MLWCTPSTNNTTTPISITKLQDTDTAAVEDQAVESQASPEVDTEDMDQAAAVESRARDMEDTALDLILSRQRAVTVVMVVDQAQGSLVRDLVDMVDTAVEDQAQANLVKDLVMEVTDREVIQRVQREATEDTDQARAVANLVRDLVVTVLAVAQVNLGRVDMDRARVVSYLIWFMFIWFISHLMFIISQILSSLLQNRRQGPWRWLWESK